MIIREFVENPFMIVKILLNRIVFNTGISKYLTRGNEHCIMNSFYRN